MSKRILILPDTQIPFDDRKAMKAVIRAVGDLQPDEVIHIGDLLDLPQPSRWNKNTRGEFEGSVYEDSEQAKQRLLGPLREVYDGPIGVHEGNHDCLSENARAVTRRGFVDVKDLTPYDQVMSVDDEGQTIWQRIDEIVKYPFSGELNTVVSTRVAFEVTDNHRIVGHKKRSGRWTEVTPGFSDRFKVYTSGTSSNPDYGLGDSEIRIAVWALTDAFRTESGRWEFYQAESKMDRIQGLLDELGLTYTVRVANRDISEIDGKVLKTAPQPQYVFRVDRGGSDRISSLVAERYALPEWFLSLSSRQARVALEEWQFTDGTKPSNGKSTVLYISNTPLREQVQTFLVSHGYSATAVEYRPGHFRLNVVEASTTEIYSSRMSKVPYEGVVWCLRVPNGRFFVEQDGKVHLTGNSRARDYLEKNAPALAGTKMFNIENLLDFDGFGIELLPEFYKVAPGWITTHGHRGQISISRIAGNTALNAARKFGTSVVMGHTHRAGVLSHTTGYGGDIKQVLTGMEVGNLMNMKLAQYLKGGTGNWQQAFGLLTIDGQHVKPEVVPIHKGRFTVDGHTWEV